MKPDAFLRLNNGTICIERDKKVEFRVPFHHIGSVFLTGHSMISPGLLQACTERGVKIVWFDRNGRFIGALRGPTTGNVLLRIAQYEHFVDREKKRKVAKEIVAGKMKNARNLIMRKSRDRPPEKRTSLKTSARKLDELEGSLSKAQTLDQIRGVEGIAAKIYFSAWNDLLTVEDIQFSKRSRRPPLNPVNAIMSFSYAIMLGDCRSALEGVGLDPQLGFLHEPRPGRHSLALDILEEFRTSVCDRLVLALLNRRQLTVKHFVSRPGGACHLNDEGKKIFLTAYQENKSVKMKHNVLDIEIELGLVPHIQARLLARFLRGDLENYVPFLR